MQGGGGGEGGRAWAVQSIEIQQQRSSNSYSYSSIIQYSGDALRSRVAACVMTMAMAMGWRQLQDVRSSNHWA